MNKILVLQCGLIFIFLLGCCSADPTPDVTIVVKAQSSPLIYIKQALMSIQRSVQQRNGELSLNAEVIVALSSSAKYDGLDSLIASLKTQYDGVPISLIDPNNTETVVSALNKAASLARAPYLLFLDEAVELISVESVHSMLNTFADQQDTLGQLGCKVISSDDRSVHRAGVEFIMAHNPSKTRFTSMVWSNNAGSDQGEDPEDIPIIFHRYEGYNSMDTRTLVAEEVHAVSADCMMMPRELFLTAGKFNESYLHHYFDVDLSQRLIRNLTKKVKFHPTAVMLFNEDTLSENSRDDDLEHADTKRDLAIFQENYGAILHEEITAAYQVKNFTVVWNMECGTGQVLGFTTEATGFLMGLSSKLRVKIKVNNMDECKEELRKIGLPASTRKIMGLLMQGDFRNKGDFALVIHRDPGRYSFFKNSLSYNEEPDYVIGRSMYETDRIPSGWVDQCNDEVDEIWVPSHFNVDTFSKAGVNSSKLFVVPESIDTHHYNPVIHKPMRELAQSHKFKYLAVGKWEKRKAWNVLLPTYFDLFKTGTQHSGNVELIVRARMDEDSKHEYEQIVHKYINESGVELSTLPPVRFLDTLLSYMKMPSLYKSVDCFVLPSHGEGWGLPYMEAMSMQVPTIGTNWSGNTEFMTNENSYLLDVDKMEDANDDGHKWATVSQTHLREQMSKCLEDRADAQLRATLARSSVVTNFDVHAASQKAIARLLEIQAKLPQVKASRPQQTNTNSRFNFGQEPTPRGGTDHSWQRYRNRQPVGTTFNANPNLLPPRTDGKTRIKIIE
jgi:glycosyltransferase involved in cell wall biosynthesis